MKKDLDDLMAKSNIDALLITGAGDHNPYMVYLTGGAHLTQADLIKIRGVTGIIYCGSMEREEAARTGLNSRSFSDYPMQEYLKKAEGDYTQAAALRYKQMLIDSGINSGKIGLYGQSETGRAFSIFSTLQSLFPEVTLVGYMENDPLQAAMRTKDLEEIARIRHMGKITTSVMSKVADFLSQQRVKANTLVDSNGEPITIGFIKKQINLWLAETGAENPEGTIFASGRDAAVPHSSGNPSDSLRLGETIVFDIYPCEQGGGYFYDMTRTWCLGYARDEALAIYEQVFSVYNQIIGELKVNTPFWDYQKRTCELFETQGHPTVLGQPKTESGYVHSLGHGLGLHVHESPWAQNLLSPDILTQGDILTIEPGLYYPERGLGVRIEDTYAINQDGTFEILADFPKDLVLPIKRG